MKGTNKMVTVYTLPACVQCESTKRLLTRSNVPFEEINMSENLDALDMVKALGYTAAPVVMAGDDHWSGFRPDKLATLTQ